MSQHSLTFWDTDCLSVTGSISCDFLCDLFRRAPYHFDNTVSHLLNWCRTCVSAQQSQVLARRASRTVQKAVRVLMGIEQRFDACSGVLHRPHTLRREMQLDPPAISFQWLGQRSILRSWLYPRCLASGGASYTCRNRVSRSRAQNRQTQPDLLA